MHRMSAPARPRPQGHTSRSGHRQREPNGHMAGHPLREHRASSSPCRSWDLAARFTPKRQPPSEAEYRSAGSGDLWRRLAAGNSSRTPGLDPRVEIGYPPPAAATAARHADGIVGDRAVDRYGWSWPLPPAGTDPSLRREPSSSSPDRGPAGSWGHERLIGWRCLRALPLGSVREPAWPGHARR